MMPSLWVVLFILVSYVNEQENTRTTDVGRKTNLEQPVKIRGLTKRRLFLCWMSAHEWLWYRNCALDPVAVPLWAGASTKHATDHWGQWGMPEYVGGFAGRFIVFRNSRLIRFIHRLASHFCCVVLRIVVWGFGAGFRFSFAMYFESICDLHKICVGYQVDIHPGWDTIAARCPIVTSVLRSMRSWARA